MRRLLGALALWLAAACATAATPPAQVRVAVVATDFVLPAKVRQLDAWGAPSGVRLQQWSPEAAAAADWGAIDLLILDTPRPGDAARVQAALDERLATAATPWLRVGGGPPAGNGLPEPLWRRLAGYYGGGGEANFRTLLAALAAWGAGGDPLALPAPTALPAAGVWHPQAPGAFASVRDYLRWGTARWPADAPRIGLIVPDGAIGALQTATLDAVVAALEARGLAPVPLWFDRAPGSLSALVEGAGLVALVNMTHLQGGTALRDELAAIGVPVLQTVGHRGSAGAWAASPSGFAQHLVAPFLAQPETWGLSDPLVISAVEDGRQVPLPAQVDLLADKLAAMARLAAAPRETRRLALMFWNYPAGEKNLSASNLNLPRSLEHLVARLREAGYRVAAADEAALIEAGQAMLGGLHRPETLDALLARDLAVALPVARYRAWLDTLPAARREALQARWGEPEAQPSVRQVDGTSAFVVPRLALDHLVVLPQPPRGARPGEATHDASALPSHAYLATYLYVREILDAHALIHMGTHGTQEWTPGKDRGLAADDYPMLAVGHLPVFYPYVQDNVGEAMQAKRRGRAVIVSHQTPPFAPAGLYDELRDVHALVHEWLQAEPGAVRDRTAAQLRAQATASGLDADMGWDAARIDGDFDGFFEALHDHLHALARSVMPLGLHSFGVPAAPEHRLATVMQQLGTPYYAALGLDPQEVFAEDFAALAASPPHALLHRHLREGAPSAEIDDPALRAMVERAATLDAALAETGEIEALLDALDGHLVAPGEGGDPIRNPDVRGGRNLYAFEADKLPTRAAYATGGEALDGLVEGFRAEHGEAPRKLAFSLWSSEAIRHLGVSESQVLHALGLRPAWDAGGRVTALEIVPRAELGRPRIDVVVQVTSVYRDQFDGFMRLLAEAMDRLAALDEPDNPLRRNSEAVAARLVGDGVPPARAARLARLRIFGNAPGEYGSGLSGAVLDSTAWEDEAPLAEQFLSRLQYAYGAEDWGVALADAPGGANLFAEQLRGVQAAVLSRSSNLHGLLSTDHPFEYLGGLSLAVRQLDGTSPALYVSDLRQDTPRLAGAAAFLASELRARTLNPHWIGAMQAEGYAGTLEVLNAANNLFGWQVADPSTVRDDQWQAIHDTYVRDVRDLGIDAWFEAANPEAQAQLIDRLLEAVRKDYWDADARTLRELVARRGELAERFGALPAAAATRAFTEDLAAGFGLSAPASPGEAGADGAVQPVRGQVLQQVAAAEPRPERTWLGLVPLLAVFLLGAARQARANRPLPSPSTHR
ncbi:cobaltochelatase subunit CobN [Coralloluteibacterium thermophilus]|uniref:Cobaltochelatase subunit CobN n=1 Tax=Coralloluteibacterium thermophilum TaxID=2707049 RepID=A0ABV9NMJ1_9GAMM